jgi:LmbE family N-acetylglucosaminyl deacetylase
MPKKNYQLLLVAHPDDESIFFSGLVQCERKLPWKLIVLTDANADGQAKRRSSELKNAAKILGIKSVEQWNYPDIYKKRLPVQEIAQRLEKLPTPARVFTHGPLGEYGHPHHQDACLAAYQAFYKKTPLFSLAHNTSADLVIRLGTKEFNKKAKLFAQIYFDETKRFIHLLPAQAQEAFVQLDAKEVKRFVEKIVTKAREGNTFNVRRHVQAILPYKQEALVKLFLTFP